MRAHLQQARLLRLEARLIRVPPPLPILRLLRPQAVSMALTLFRSSQLLRSRQIRSLATVVKLRLML